MTLLLRDEDVKKVLTLDDVLKMVEEAYRQEGKALAGIDGFSCGCIPPPKRELRIKGKNMPHGSPQNIAIGQGMASLEKTGMAVLQHYFSFPDRQDSMFHLVDANHGETLAVIMDNSRYISLMRTGSTGAVAAKYLSRKNSEIAGMIGTGKQGRIQLLALSKVRQIKKAFAYSDAGRDFDEQYAREMSNELNIEVMVTNGAKEAVESSDIVVTATRSAVPIVEGHWINPGLHINSIGADCPMKSELHASVFKRADKLVIDCQQALESADIRILFEQGILKPENVYASIGEIVAGVKAGREDKSEITIFKSVGTTLPYVTICAKIYEKAVKEDLGTQISSLL